MLFIGSFVENHKYDGNKKPVEIWQRNYYEHITGMNMYTNG
jgi:hypothetical protein